MPLQLEPRDGEKLLINGALIEVRGKRFVFLNEARVVYGDALLLTKPVGSDVVELYWQIQQGYAGSAQERKPITKLAELVAAVRQAHSRDTKFCKNLSQVEAHIRANKVFLALKVLQPYVPRK